MLPTCQRYIQATGFPWKWVVVLTAMSPGTCPVADAKSEWIGDARHEAQACISGVHGSREDGQRCKMTERAAHGLLHTPNDSAMLECYVASAPSCKGSKKRKTRIEKLGRPCILRLLMLQ
ncbi:hypothetical protein BKA80DRAFT_219388 [Phyllosticta citrichinensis]